MDNISSNNITSNTDLPTTSQSYSEFYTAFQKALSRNPEWNTKIPNGVGSTLLSILAAMSTSYNYFGSRKLQEGYLETAQSPLGVLTSAKSISGKLFSNNPSIGSINYEFKEGSLATYTLPPHSIFSINGKSFYNYDYLDFNSNDKVEGSFTLIEGTKLEQSFSSSGLAFQKFYLSNGFKAGDYVIVKAFDPTTLQETIWEKVDSIVNNGCTVNENEDLYNSLSYVPKLTYESSVYPDGTVCVSFGDGVFGAIPPANTTISITYFECSGGSLNTVYTNDPKSQPKVVLLSSPTYGLDFVSAFNKDLDLKCSAIVAGGKPPSYLFYKKLAPAVSASGLRQVSPPDFESAIESFLYSGSNFKPIKACKVITERDSIKNNPMLVNTIVPILIMDQVLYSNEEFKGSLSDMLSETSTPCVISPILFEPVPFKVTVNIKYTDFSISEGQLKKDITTALINYLKIYANDVIEIDNIASPYWNIDTASKDLLGKTYNLSNFYSVLLPIIGKNSCTIDYLYNGSSNEFSVNSYQCLAFDFSSGNNPIDIFVVR